MRLRENITANAPTTKKNLPDLPTREQKLPELEFYGNQNVDN